MPIEKVRAYSKTRLLHWTEEEFSSCFRKMLTLEQYRDSEMAQLYQKYLAAGPLDAHIDHFIHQMESVYRKEART